MKLNLPKDFIWGTATAAHQVEGNNTNSDFWLLENTKNTTFAEPSGIACDQLNRYEEDIKLMSSHAIQSYRPVSYTHLRAPRDVEESRMPSSA